MRLDANLHETNKNEKSEPKDFPWVTEFTEDAAINFHEQITSRFEENPYKPIIIHISSYGGEVDALFSMMDSMDNIRSMAPPEFKFMTICMGKALSAGAVLLAYGDYRFAAPNSRIMLHQIVSGTFGNHPDNEVEFSEINRMNTRLLNILKQRCKFNMSIKEMKKMLSHNVHLTPEKAKDLGVIDIIGYPMVLEKKIYQIQVVNGEAPKGKSRANRGTNKSTAESED